MRKVVLILLLGLAQVSSGIDRNVRETWSGIGVGLSGYGVLAGDRCAPSWYEDTVPIEFPLGADVHFTYMPSIWIGALIESNGGLHPRVSIADDGWENPSIHELHPNYDEYEGILETAHFDTSYDLPECTIVPEVDWYSRADHEFAVTLYDTLTSRLFVRNDPFDGAHVPLGLRVDVTTYAFTDFCIRTVWLRLHVSNIGNQNLRDMWCGISGWAEVTDTEWNDLRGLVGYEHENDFAYIHSRTGRTDSSNGEVISRAAVAIVPLYNPTVQSVSFNWWTNYFAMSNYGPSWVSYAIRDSLGGRWTSLRGAPRGDRERYFLLRNREHDYNPLRYCDEEWIYSHTPQNQMWNVPAINCETMDSLLEQSPIFLLSSGPHGVARDGYRSLNPGESTDIWFAIVGGMEFHDRTRPQPADTVDPNFYNLNDLIDRVDMAKNGPCFAWLDAQEARPDLVKEFSLFSPYPNPFNSEVRITFSAPRNAEVQVDVVNVLGQTVETLFTGVSDGSARQLAWRANDAATGVYFMRLMHEGKAIAVQKVMLMK